jgi:cold shock CspA family protein
VITREFRACRDIRQHAVKTPDPCAYGRIARLFPDRGYGIIETDVHRDAYFHANAIRDRSFEVLEVGMLAELDIEAGHAGHQVSRVMLHKL